MELLALAEEAAVGAALDEAAVGGVVESIGSVEGLANVAVGDGWCLAQKGLR